MHMPSSDGLKQCSHSDTTQQLQVIYADIDQRLRAMTAACPNWPCRKGCDNCCRQLARPPEMTAAEWHVVQQGLAQLPPETQHEVGRRIQALAYWQGAPVTCPFLDATHGACLIYTHRPAACRMYGFYVSRTAHWWCGDIQALYDAGDCDGLILGNYGAIERALHDQCGEVKSLLEWFTQVCEVQESS
jgi:Fe-S-cluster containining protein